MPDHRIFILRKERQNEWLAKANAGNEEARMCVGAARSFMKEIPDEPGVCPCCDTPFSRYDLPRAFIILVPAKEDQGTIQVQIAGICVECSKHDDKWLVEQGLKRQGWLAPTPRSSDRIH